MFKIFGFSKYFNVFMFFMFSANDIQFYRVEMRKSFDFGPFYEQINNEFNVIRFMCV